MNNAPSQPLERVMEYIQSGNSAEALKVLSGYQPSSRDMASYHLAYAKAYELSGKQYDSIAHLRLAYLYSKDNKMKEQTLIERAEAYAKIVFHYEASLIFKIFLKNSPHSRYEERGFLGLADTFYRLGLFSEAKEAYEKAGNSSRALYGKANALHSMGKIEDAHGGYLTMLEKDHLDVAKKFFSSALQSSERHLRRQVLLNLADTNIKQGKQGEAKSRLLEIRKQYPYGKDYDEALLMLLQLYKKEGNFKEATSLIKELVFRYSPNQKALDEFEGLILGAGDKGEEDLLKLWRAGGHWLLQPSRSPSILKIAKGLRHSGKSYLETCTWLSHYGF